MNKLNKSRKICKTQLEMGKKILRTKTRKAAMKLLRKVPYMRPGDFKAGLTWWRLIQTVPEKERAAFIEYAAKPTLKACIEKHSHTVSESI